MNSLTLCSSLRSLNVSVFYKLDPVHRHLAAGGVIVGVAEVSVDKIPGSSHASSGTVIRGWYRLFPPDSGSAYRQDSD